MSVFLSLRHGMVLSIPLEDKDQWVLTDVYTVFAYDLERTMGILNLMAGMALTRSIGLYDVFPLFAVFFDSDPIRKAMYSSPRNRQNAIRTLARWTSGDRDLYSRFLEDKGIEPWTDQMNADVSMFEALLPVYPNGPDSALTPTSNPSDQVQMPNPPTQAPDACPAFVWLIVLLLLGSIHLQLLLLGSMEATNDNDNEANDDNDNAKSVLLLLGSMYLQPFMLVVDWLVEVMHSLH
jgi:hypothetical protein